MCALLYNTISPVATAPPASSSLNMIAEDGGDNVNNAMLMPLPELTLPFNKKQRSNSTKPGLYSYMSSPGEVIQRYLLGYSAKTKRSLSEEAECGNETSVCSWIRDGCDPNELDAYGYTPLLNAAALGRLNAVVELTRNGADINRTGPFGFTPMHAAAQNGHREVVAILLKNGANINAQNDDMDTPMHLALKCHHMEIVFMLVRNGGNPLLKGFQNKDCVLCAKQMGLVDLANRLKNYNVSIGHHARSNPEFRRN